MRAAISICQIHDPKWAAENPWVAVTPDGSIYFETPQREDKPVGRRTVFGVLAPEFASELDDWPKDDDGRPAAFVVCKNRKEAGIVAAKIASAAFSNYRRHVKTWTGIDMLDAVISSEPIVVGTKRPNLSTKRTNTASAKTPTKRAPRRTSRTPRRAINREED